MVPKVDYVGCVLDVIGGIVYAKKLNRVNLVVKNANCIPIVIRKIFVSVTVKISGEQVAKKMVLEFCNETLQTL